MPTTQPPTPPAATQPAGLLSALNQAAEALWQACEADWPGLSIEVRPQVDSTNTLLMQQGRQGLCAPTVMLAVSQTAGRGRHGRSWLAHPGDTLAFSVGLPLALDRVPGGGSALSLAVGLALAEALDQGLSSWASQQHHPATASPPNLPPTLSPIGLKWPNDLWLGSRKLGGILIEATPAPGLPEAERWVVIGVGLNVQGPPPTPEATSLWPRGASGSAPDQALATVWRWLVPALLSQLRSFMHTGFAPLQARFAQRDVLLGQTVQSWAPRPDGPTGTPLGHGQCLGVDADGALLVHTAQGLQRWTSGEVTVRPASAAVTTPSGS